MTSRHKSEDYKLSAVEYYLVGDKSQIEVCEIFKCSPRSLMRWVEKYDNIIKGTYNRTKKYSKKSSNRRKTLKNYL